MQQPGSRSARRVPPVLSMRRSVGLLEYAAATATVVAVAALGLRLATGPGTPGLASLPVVDLGALGVGDTTSVVSGSGRHSVTVLSDYRCRYCADLHYDLKLLASRHGFRVRWVALPLLGGESLEAAIVSECARRVGRFDQVHDRLFAMRDSLGRVPWSRFEPIAGPDALQRYRVCVGDKAPEADIRSIAGRLQEAGLRATPTVLINDRLLGGYPGREVLSALLAEATRWEG